MPKIFDPLSNDDKKALDELKSLWDRIQDDKQAYDTLLTDLSGRLSPIQISQFTGLSRQRIDAQMRRATKRIKR